MGFTAQASISRDGEITATCSTDENPHPDLMDEMERRCGRLLMTTFLALPDEGGDDVAESEEG